MANTLLIRLQAPMQSYGAQSLFDRRDTAREPTRSGVIGLLCAALGRSRGESLDDFSILRMGLRIDQEGVLMKDYQIALDTLLANGKKNTNAVPSDRYYLADAVFLVGLECDDLSFLEELQTALKHPTWLLFLGRRAFPPSKPVWLPDGLRAGESLESALHSYPYLLGEKQFERAGRLRIMLEDAEGSLLQQDLPVSFEQRTFQQRIQRVDYIDKPLGYLKEEVDVVP